MLLVIFSWLFSAILLCALWFHDVEYPPEGRAEHKQWKYAPASVSRGNQPTNRLVARLPSSHPGKEAEPAFLLFHEERRHL